MYAYIKGILEEKASGFIVVDVMGIGYKIYMSEPCISQLGDLGTTVKIYTHHHVREDEISLYGFCSNEELKMFELLIGVSGIGAKSALIILANMEPSSFALAVITNDTSKLVKIPGVGPKSAARIVLELKDKLKSQEINNVELKEETKEIVNTEEVQEAMDALQVLGYHKKEIEKVMSSLNLKELTVEKMIKQGLKELSK